MIELRWILLRPEDVPRGVFSVPITQFGMTYTTAILQYRVNFLPTMIGSGDVVLYPDKEAEWTNVKALSE